MEQPLVSIVIPIVRNDKHIIENIRHIKESSYTNYEIIVIDMKKERSFQRNKGIEKAKGKYLLILDSDMMVTYGLIQNCVTLMEENPDCYGVYIPERIVTRGWFGKLRDWERQFYNGTLVDVVRFVRNPCPLFDEEFHGVEDSDWERRISGKRLTCDWEVHHHDKCGVVQFLRKKAYYAKCLKMYKAKNPNDKLLTFKYRCIQVFIENGKWKRLISKPHYTIGVALLLFARGMIFLWAKLRY